MIDNKRVLAIIPARGGSKGIPRKNIKEIAGKPLIAWTIEEAKKSKYIDRLILSSDDQEIIEVAKSFNCDVPFVRPKDMAQDDSPGIDTVLHAIEILPENDYIVLLQPTSPLRSVEDIDKAVEICVNQNLKSCVSVTKSSKSPYWMYQINETGALSPLFNDKEIPYQRQLAPTTYELNGAVYVATLESLELYRSFLQDDTVPYIMPKERSVDIDSIEDFMFCECLLNKIS